MYYINAETKGLKENFIREENGHYVGALNIKNATNFPTFKEANAKLNELQKHNLKTS